MKEKKTIIYVIATILIVLILIFYRPESNNVITRTPNIQTIQSENKTIDATKRKQEILKQIDQINKAIAETFDQEVIDQLAKEKETLMHEYMQLDQMK